MKHGIVCLALLFAFFAHLDQAWAADREVPGTYASITAGIAACTPGVDRVIVWNANPNNPTIAYAESVTMISAVPVLAKEGESPIIDAGSLAASAVTWPSDAGNNTVLDGFTIRGGTDQVVSFVGYGEIQNCTIENGGAGGPAIGILTDDYPLITNCAVTMSGSQTLYGIKSLRRSPVITGCTLNLSGSGDQYGIYAFGGGPSYGTPEISGCEVTMTGSSQYDESYGIYNDSGTMSISGCTLSLSATGYQYGIYSDTAAPAYGTMAISGCDISISGSQTSFGIANDHGLPSITDCTIDVETGDGIDVGAESATTGGEVSNCHITVGDGDGVFAYAGSFAIHDVTVTGGGYNHAGIRCGYTLGQLRSTVSSSLINMDGGVAVWILDDSTKVENLTIDCGGTGEGIYSANGTVTVKNCIVTNAEEDYGFENVNAEYCIGDGPDPYHGGSQGTGSVVEDPLFCDASQDIYTLRVDSYGNPGNNASEKAIGAFPVTCMFGTLVRNADYAGDGDLYVPGDVTIPNGKSLTLGSYTTVRARDADSLATGSDTGKTEITLNSGGSLTVSGTGGHPVVFTSAATSPEAGDWRGIRVNSGATASINYADVRYTDYGIEYFSIGTGNISHSRFSESTNYQIGAGGGSTMDLTIEEDTLVVVGGKGIYLQAESAGTTIQKNRILGDEFASSYAGIQFGLLSSGAAPLITENHIEGFTYGYGVYSHYASPTLTKNNIYWNTYGIYTDGGAAQIGVQDDWDSRNTFDLTYNGMKVSGGTPKVRSNDFTGNRYSAVLVNSSGNPDLGTSSYAGGNDMSDNGHYCIENNNSSVTVQAVGNYFGECPTTCYTGNVNVSDCLESPPSGADVAIGEVAQKITRPVVHGVFPNPMRSASRLAFSLPAGSENVRVKVYNLAGRTVKDFGELGNSPGRHEVLWDGRDDQGGEVGNGIYFIRVIVDQHQAGAVKTLVVR